MSLEALLAGNAGSPADAYRRYRIVVTAYNTAAAVIISELELINEQGQNVGTTGTPFASSYYNASFYPQYAFDGQWPVYSNTAGKAWQTNTPAPQYLGTTLSAPVKLSRYGIRYPESIGSTAAGYYPNSWRIEGSNDGTTWVKLHEVTSYTSDQWLSKAYHTWDIPA